MPIRGSSSSIFMIMDRVARDHIVDDSLSQICVPIYNDMSITVVRMQSHAKEEKKIFQLHCFGLLRTTFKS
ncbi:hypothetical protein DERP_009251 [Dermatophagoides pteronyssinus]|uniref:Uncharacterized protein n=1 Tax=Dermatophagoides pteronyssinus TaxID=6956 RepID=A0ABQ8JQZ7_DERPT|nr:hypothetical protein DERP_009251 [Dermatophagoides pteronyssinus]